MSGGHFSYYDRTLGEEMFGYGVDIDYGEDGHKCSKKARALNPMQDREISELVFDVLCLIHSYDWYVSGDTDEEQYKSDKKWFKIKWLNVTNESRKEAYIEDLKAYFDTLVEELSNT